MDDIKSLSHSKWRCKYYYDIIVLEKEISDYDQKLLKDEFSDYGNISLRFFDPSKRFDGIDLYVSSEAYSVEAYYRILKKRVYNISEIVFTPYCSRFIQIEQDY